MKNFKRSAVLVLSAAFFLTGVLVLTSVPADAQEAAGAAPSLTDKIKAAGATGIGTAADETAKGSDINTATSKGASAALNNALGAAAPAAAIPTAPAVPAAPAAPAAAPAE